MKRFFVKFLCFLAVFFLFDRTFILFKYGTANLFAEIASKKARSFSAYLKENKVDSVAIGIFGSSHAQFGISPEIIEQATSKPAINFGYGGGTNIGTQYNYIRKLNIKMKEMVYAIDVFSLNTEPQETDKFQDVFFAAYYGNGQQGSYSYNSFFNEQKEQIHTMGFLNYASKKLTGCSCIYLYGHFISNYLSDIRKGNYTLPYFRKNDSFDLAMFSVYRGYSISDRGWVQGNGLLNKRYIRYRGTAFQPDKGAVEQLEKITNYCKANNIKLYIIQVPEHACCLGDDRYANFHDFMTQFARANDVTFYDFDNPGNFDVTNDSLFFDSDHLNARGARLFTKKLTETLRL